MYERLLPRVIDRPFHVDAMAGASTIRWNFCGAKARSIPRSGWPSTSLSESQWILHNDTLAWAVVSSCRRFKEDRQTSLLPRGSRKYRCFSRDTASSPRLYVSDSHAHGTCASLCAGMLIDTHAFRSSTSCVTPLTTSLTAYARTRLSEPFTIPVLHSSLPTRSL